VYDNQFSGTIPSGYSSLSWIAVAYNPGLVGQLPSGLNSSKLYAYSAYTNGLYSWYYAYTLGAGQLYGYPPSYNNAGYGTGWLYGTSIGLDRPLAAILMDIKAAVDPSGAYLPSWNSSAAQPCRPWSNLGSAPMQSAASATRGAGWKYISTVSVVGSAEYCQDWQNAGSNYAVYNSPTTWATNTIPVGGIAALWLSGAGLNGTLPVQLQELRTATAVSLSVNSLTGTLPSAWCVPLRAALLRIA
jgi:hypothetical protein